MELRTERPGGRQQGHKEDRSRVRTPEGGKERGGEQAAQRRYEASRERGGERAAWEGYEAGRRRKND